MREIVLLVGAQIDLQDCYERQPNVAKAEQFERELRSAYTQLATFSRSTRHFEAGFRRYIFSDFPYGLFYVIEGNRVMIHAVLDTRLPREVIRRRLGLT